MIITPKNKIIITIIGFALIAGMVSIFLIYPIFNSIAESSAEIELRADDLARLNQEAENIREFQSFSKENRQDIDKIGEAFVDPENPLEFIEFIESQADLLGLVVKITPNEAVKKEGEVFPSMVFNLSVIGKFSNFMVLLKKMESSGFLISTTGLNIKRI
ncbi:MAG: hypothetical protein Q7T34_02030, partial [Candidatus Parcubacteria bacterium]|nr:hypothetical protein [Candidatus Parcubacteria bacterium]